MEPKFKKGDRVEVIPNEGHQKHVHDYYGKVLIVEKVCIGSKSIMYKLKGTKNYALESDLNTSIK